MTIRTFKVCAGRFCPALAEHAVAQLSALIRGRCPKAKPRAKVMGSLPRLLVTNQCETNADALAIKMFVLAGYDLEKARYVLMRMAKLDPSLKSRILESHPAGVERIVAFDKYRENL